MAPTLTAGAATRTPFSPYAATLALPYVAGAVESLPEAREPEG
ncbi:MAG: hypothetical protein ACRDPG_13955 [Nocardioidaceae bacterium]